MTRRGMRLSILLRNVNPGQYEELGHYQIHERSLGATLRVTIGQYTTDEGFLDPYRDGNEATWIIHSCVHCWPGFLAHHMVPLGVMRPKMYKGDGFVRRYF